MILKSLLFCPELEPQAIIKMLNEMISRVLNVLIFSLKFKAIYLFKISLKNHCENFKRLYLCTRQVLHNQLLLNPPGRERSKGKWS